MISKDREYSLRIELAQAREEIARLSEIIEQRDVDWATERAARERAEAAFEGEKRARMIAERERDTVRIEMSKLPQSETVAARYPTNSMCASGHQMVLWMDEDFERCPVCRAEARVNAIAEMNSLAPAVFTAHGKMPEIRTAISPHGKERAVAEEPEAFQPEIGDWIMWNTGDGLRIGEVRFRRKEEHYPWRWESVTNSGVISDERVLELRKVKR